MTTQPPISLDLPSKEALIIQIKTLQSHLGIRPISPNNIRRYKYITLHGILKSLSNKYGKLCLKTSQRSILS